jgi:hypothetical protein
MLCIGTGIGEGILYTGELNYKMQWREMTVKIGKKRLTKNMKE